TPATATASRWRLAITFMTCRNFGASCPRQALKYWTCRLKACFPKPGSAAGACWHVVTAGSAGGCQPVWAMACWQWRVRWRRHMTIRTDAVSRGLGLLLLLAVAMVFSVAMAMDTQALRDSADGRLAHIFQRGRLIVGVKTDYPPWGMYDRQGEITGIEPALA